MTNPGRIAAGILFSDEAADVGTKPQLVLIHSQGAKLLVALIHVTGELQTMPIRSLLLEELGGGIQPDTPDATEEQLGLPKIMTHHLHPDTETVTNVKDVPAVPDVLLGSWPKGAPILRKELAMSLLGIVGKELKGAKRENRVTNQKEL